MSKQPYSRPELVRYGAIRSLTLGKGGSRPDMLNGQLVNNNCFTFGSAGVCSGTT